MDFAIVGIYSG